MRKWYGKLAIIGVLLLVVGLAMQSWSAPVLRVGVLPGMQADFMKEVRAALDAGALSEFVARFHAERARGV